MILLINNNQTIISHYRNHAYEMKNGHKQDSSSVQGNKDPISLVASLLLVYIPPSRQIGLEFISFGSLLGNKM